MIKKYLEFLNESIDLVLESDVVYSDRFRKAILKISDSDKSEIAKKLLDIENQDLPVRANYFDILSDKNDKLEFIPDAKAQEILSEVSNKYKFTGSAGWLKHKSSNDKIFEKLGYVYQEGTTPHSPSSEDIGELIKSVISEISGKVYFWIKWYDSSENLLGEGVYNKDKISPIDNRMRDVWSKNRQDLKIGKAIRALLKVAKFEFNDRDLEIFVNSIKAEIDRLNDRFSSFDVVSGNDITYWYSYKRYKEQNKGTLGSSCMKGDEYFDIYENNPEVCKLVIFKSVDDDTKITGRALLWKLIDGEQFMDRIYTNDDSDVNLFKEYARENGWFSKFNNNSMNSVKADSPDGGTKELNGRIKIRTGYYNTYPYMDTFKYFTPSTGSLNAYSGDYNLETTNGQLDNSDDYCDTCGGGGEYSCYECDSDGSFRCDTCSGGGQLDCNECEGVGSNVVDDVEVSCVSCNGQGSNDCGDCEGEGSYDCGDCGGSGYITCYDC